MREKVLSAVPSVELRNGELRGCTTIRLREALTEKEWTALQEYLLGQFSDGWGESFEQRELSVPEGTLYVRFWDGDFSFEIAHERETDGREKAPFKRPRMKLIGEDGNIFSILGRASSLLRENGMPDRAKEMSERVFQSGDYAAALGIISEYVERYHTAALSHRAHWAAFSSFFTSFRVKCSRRIMRGTGVLPGRRLDIQTLCLRRRTYWEEYSRNVRGCLFHPLPP